TAVRKQNDKVNLTAIAECLDRGTAGITRGRYHDGAPLAACGQHVVHQPTQKLHRQIFERERRTVEKLKQERVAADLCERRYGGMAKIAITLARDARQIGRRHRILGKGPEDLDRDLGIRSAGKASDCRGLELRPSLRDVEAAI